MEKNNNNKQVFQNIGNIVKQEPTPRIKVLIADESSRITTGIIKSLLADGIVVESVSQFSQVVRKFASNDLDVCILALDLHDQALVDAVKQLVELNPEVSIIVLVRKTSYEQESQIRQLNPFFYGFYGLKPEQLQKIVRAAIGVRFKIVKSSFSGTRALTFCV